MFLETETNDEGIYNVRFYIRGKPWIVTVDDYMLFSENDEVWDFVDLNQGPELVMAG
jgi:hypothetical protein